MTPTQLRMAIGALNISYKDLAAATEISASHISRICNENVDPSVSMMRTLQLFFTARGVKFSAHNGDVTVTARDNPVTNKSEPHKEVP